MKLPDLEWYDEQVENAEYVMCPQRAREILAQLVEEEAPAGLDFETTGLDATISKVRLSCIYSPSVGAVVLDHFHCGDFRKMAHLYSGVLWFVYNAKFESEWFRVAKAKVDLIDVDFLAKVKRGGGHSSLAIMAKRDLRYEMDKTEQISDWSQLDLTGSQINYAALDGVITFKLAELWLSRLNKKQKQAVYIFQDAVAATVECEKTGMVLDTEHHAKNVETWKMKQELMLRRIRYWTPKHMLDNPGSDKQVEQVLRAQLPKSTIDKWPRTPSGKQLSINRKLVAPIAAKSPYPFSRWLNALIRFRYYRKYLSTYGETLITKQYLEDKITFRLNIAAAATGRYSSSSINIQNIPRAPWVRAAFLPPYGYEFFVVADYSGIEVRVLAELSGDENLIRDAVYGDVHSGSASAIYHVNEDDFIEILDSVGPEHAVERAQYKELRSKAKGFTFQLTYGAAALALSIVLKCTVAEAEDAIKKWAEKYPKAYNYRYTQFDSMSHSGYLPVCDGRTIYVSKPDRTIPVASNYGIQSAAASVMYRAMARVQQERDLVSSRRDIAMCATVHDELILAARTIEEVPLAKKILEEQMAAAWLDIFPGTSTDNLIEAKHGPNWGAAK